VLFYEFHDGRRVDTGIGVEGLVADSGHPRQVQGDDGILATGKGDKIALGRLMTPDEEDCLDNHGFQIVNRLFLLAVSHTLYHRKPNL